MKKVLVVEDSNFIANAIKIVLEAENIEVETTSDGAKVVDIVKEKNVNLIVLDLMMPNVSGKDVLSFMKADQQTKNIPIIVLTAKTDAEKWDEIIKFCDKFMTKPFDNKELVAEVKKLLA